MEALESFNKKFRIPELSICGNETWVLSLRPTQPTLGSCILSVRRPIEELAMLSGEDGAGFAALAGSSDDLLKGLFGCVRVNFLLLMHFDTQVHFHLIPRYTAPVSLFGKEWADSGWPGFPNGMTPGEGTVSEEILQEMLGLMRSKLI